MVVFVAGGNTGGLEGGSRPVGEDGFGGVGVVDGDRSILGDCLAVVGVDRAFINERLSLAGDAVDPAGVIADEEPCEVDRVRSQIPECAGACGVAVQPPRPGGFGIDEPVL